MKKALITGITGQDGSYLAEFLLEKGYDVYGGFRRASTFNFERIDHLHNPEEDEKSKIKLYHLDLDDSSSVFNLVHRLKPDEIYNLGAQSHVRISFDIPEYTGNVNALGALRVLEAIRNSERKIKFYQASSSELFGNSPPPQNENTPFNPRSPYAVAKAYAYYITKNYREAHNIFACNGILFNHESPRRGENFVTRKITKNLCEIKKGLREKFFLGNLDAKRDWGYAGDYVEAMWLMLQQDKPSDYVISTGETHSVRELAELCCKEIGFDLDWKGKGLEEIGFDKTTGKILIGIDPRYFRPTEVNCLLGDSTKVRKDLGWKPKTSLEDLVKIMIKEDMKKVDEKINGIKNETENSINSTR